MKPISPKNHNPLENRSLISMAWPMVISIGFGIALPIMDSLFLSRISDLAASSVGSLGVVIFVVFTAIQVFIQAGAAIGSQFQGAGKSGHFYTTLQWLLKIGVASGIVGGLLFWFGAPWITIAMGLAPEGQAIAILYLRILGTGMVFRSVHITLSAVANSQGLTQLNLWTNMGLMAGNAFANMAFLEGWLGLPKLGVTGVALATVINWALVDIVLLVIVQKKVGFKIRKKHFKRGAAVVLPPWVRIGVPAVIEPVSFQLHQVVITAMIVRLGVTATAARVYAGNLSLLPVIFSLGVGVATQSLVANKVGARRFDEANKVLHQGLWSASGFALLISAVTALSAPFLMKVFTTNPAVISLAIAGLWVDVALQPAKAANIVLTNALRSAGDSKFPAVVGSAMMWTFGIAMAIGLGKGLAWGLPGFWAGMALDEWSRAIVNYRRWQGGKWKEMGAVRAKHKGGPL
jgi:putative MATE family efflux protein